MDLLEMKFILLQQSIVKNRGDWILGFHEFLGNCSNFYVELWDILDGLTLLCDCDYGSVLIETNNLETVKTIQEKITNGSNSVLIRRIHYLLIRFEQ